MWEFPRTRYADCNGSEASEETEIAVNIGGVKHILYGDVLNRYPETRLAELVNRATKSTQEDLCALCDDYDDFKFKFKFKLSFIVIPLHVWTYSGTRCRASQDHGAT